MGGLRLRRDSSRTPISASSGTMGDGRSRLVWMGLADVLVVWVVAFALIRTLRVYGYGGWPSVAIWVPVCLSALRWRPGRLLLSATAFTFAVTFVPHNGLVGIGWLSLAVYLFDNTQLQFVIRVLASSIYGFTAAHKMFTPFASGAVLAASAPWLPFPRAAAFVVIFTEALLAVATWRKWRWAFPLSIVTHLGILFGMASSPIRFVELLGWQTTMPVLVYFATRYSVQRVEPDRTARDPVT